MPNRSELSEQVANQIRKALMNTEVCMQARVEEIDRNSGRVTVQPMIQVGTSTGERASRPLVRNLPIATMGGGGLFVSFPINVGDLGFIVSGDRDASLFYQSEGKEDWPNTGRIHSFSDGFFLPIKLFDFNIPEHALTDGLTLQTDDAETYITIQSGLIKMQAATLEINGDIIHTGDTDQTGDTVKKGNTEQDGGVTTTGDVVADGVSLTKHQHTGGTRPDGTTGPPIS